MAILGARKSWCSVTPIEEEPIKPPIDYIDKTDRYYIDGDGDPLDDFGTGLGGSETNEEKRIILASLTAFHYICAK